MWLESAITMTRESTNDVVERVLSSSMTRHLIAWALAAFALGTAYSSVHADIEAIAKDNRRSFELLQKELATAQQSQVIAYQDLRDRVRNMELEGNKDRDRAFLLETRLSVIETNILHIRGAIDNMSPRRGQGDGLPR
jgi:hypothetical protein